MWGICNLSRESNSSNISALSLVKLNTCKSYAVFWQSLIDYTDVDNEKELGGLFQVLS